MSSAEGLTDDTLED